MKIVQWSSAEAKRQLARRLQNAMAAQERFHGEWRDMETAIFETMGLEKGQRAGLTNTSNGGSLIEEAFANQEYVDINYVFKNVRFIHSQLSSNPPSVVARPTSNDPEDRRRADAADRLIKYALRNYRMQENFDRASLYMLTYGNGIIKQTWNPHAGDILEFDETTGEIVLEGDVDVRIVSPWNFFPDPDADCWERAQWAFERVLIPWEEALFLFPEQEQLLKNFRVNGASTSSLAKEKYDVVEIFEYWETGLPYNGKQGRFVYCTKDGTPLIPVEPSRNRFRPATEKGEPKRPPQASLPYHLFTDVDLPGTYWGKAVAAYEVPLQDIMNRLDSVLLDNLKTHAVYRMVLPEAAEICDDSIVNTPTEIIKITGNQGPWFANPPQMPVDFGTLRQYMRAGIDDMAGVNESMFGQQSREQSGFSMQYATNQGNVIRRRLFNKYVYLVESIYKSFLSLVRENWDTPRTIKVLGKEKAFEAMDIEGANINGGFDLVVEYGTSLSLDPITRREEMLAMLPLFEKAGVSARTFLSMLKLADLSSAYDIISLSEDRQREIFEEMGATGDYIEPQRWEHHEGMLEWARSYVMTSEFKYLTEEHKALIIKHVEARAAMVPAPAAAPAPNTAAAIPGMPVLG